MFSRFFRLKYVSDVYWTVHNCASAGSPDTTLAEPHPNSNAANQERNQPVW